jgi:hypothetical protein
MTTVCLEESTDSENAAENKEPMLLMDKLYLAGASVVVPIMSAWFGWTMYDSSGSITEGVILGTFAAVFGAVFAIVTYRFGTAGIYDFD